MEEQTTAPDGAFWREVTDVFGLPAVRSAERVTGGLSNDLWRATCGTDVFAVKAMGVNADAPDFQDNVEAAFIVERAAFEAGVPCPEPVRTLGGGCLARAGGRWVRVHRWVDGEHVDAALHAQDAGRLLSLIHAAGKAQDAELDDEPWDEAGWRSLSDSDGIPGSLAAELRHAAPALAALEAATAAPGLRVRHTMSHGDLDPKNTLLVNGSLLALDWDAAGPQSTVREAVTVALDWTTGPDRFRDTVDAYVAAGGSAPPAEPWVLGGWVSAIGGWLVYNAQHRAGTALGAHEAAAAAARLIALQDQLPEYLAALR